MNAPDSEFTGREWEVRLPPGMKLLSANSRLHHMAEYRIGKEIQDAVIWLCRQQRIPKLERVQIDGFWHVADRRRRDPANLQPTCKQAVDGLVKAGVLDDDDDSRVAGPFMFMVTGQPDPCFVLRIRELR